MKSPVPVSRAADPARVSGLVVLTLLLAMSVTLLAPGPTAAAPTRDTGPDARVATPVRATPSAPRSEHRALDLLRRVAEADRRVAYSGVQFVSAWSSAGTASKLVEVQNVPGQGTALRVRGSGSGPAAALFSSSPEDGVDTALGGGPVKLLSANYAVRYGGKANATGRSAQVVELVEGRGVLAARFWVDRETGLALRRELYDASGRTVRASAFAQIRIGRKSVPSHLPPISRPVTGEVLSVSDTDDLARGGWACPATMADDLTLYGVRQVETSSGEVLHLSYSDGLSTVSVFQQAGSIGSEGPEGYQRVEGPQGVRFVRAGIPQQVVWSADGIVYSVVADAPSELVERVVADLPAPSAPTVGMLGRLGRGLDRVGSWVNPFG